MNFIWPLYSYALRKKISGIITNETHVIVSMVWLTQIVEFIQSVEFSTPQQYNSACIKSNPSNIGGEIAKININIDFHDPIG